MKTPVSDSAVNEYAARIRAGIPLGELFPAPMSACDFTENQRQIIRDARHDRKAQLKKAKASPPKPAPAIKSAEKSATKVSFPAKNQKPKGGSKLGKMLYLQAGRCFFCGQPLEEKDASIEHLNPKSKGGKSTDDNEVVCHASLNDTFGNMDLKRKFEFTLRMGGAFRCPGT